MNTLNISKDSVHFTSQLSSLVHKKKRNQFNKPGISLLKLSCFSACEIILKRRFKKLFTATIIIRQCITNKRRWSSCLPQAEDLFRCTPNCGTLCIKVKVTKLQNKTEIKRDEICVLCFSDSAAVTPHQTVVFHITTGGNKIRNFGIKHI